MRLSKFTLVLLVSLLSLLLVDYVTGRGGRGGGGGRFGGSRGGYRSGGGYRSRSRSSSGFRSSRYTKYAAAAAAGYTIYGMTRYRSRYYGTSYYRTDPNICTNVERYATYDNGTLSRTQKLDYFVCPYDSEDKEDEIYCCGPDTAQHCCAYWDSSNKGGAIAGIVIGSIVFLIILAVCCCYCCKKASESRESSSPSASYQPTKSEPVLLGQNGVPDHHDTSAGYPAYNPRPGGDQPYPAAYPPAASYPPAAPQPASAPYPPEPTNPSAIGFESQAPPPDYAKATAYPPS